MSEIPFGLPDHAPSVDGQALIRYPHRALHVVLATTGSVASIKLLNIVEELLKVSLRCLSSSSVCKQSKTCIRKTLAMIHHGFYLYVCYIGLTHLYSEKLRS